MEQFLRERPTNFEDVTMIRHNWDVVALLGGGKIYGGCVVLWGMLINFAFELKNR